MSGPAGSSTWFGKDPVYEIGQSLRFEDGSSSYLSRTPASAGNRRTWTFSAWVKQGTISTNRSLFGANVGSNAIYIDSSDVFTLEYYNGAGGTNFYKATTAKLRDASAWYHVVGVWNTTSGTADDRIQLWVNGTRVTEFSASNNPGQNLDSHINNNITHNVGNRGYNPIAGANWDGYMAEVNFIDGLALPAYYFGTTGVHGEWKPIKYVGAYGTNGFYLTGAAGAVMSATGGNSTATDGDFKAASFTSSGTFTPSADGYVEYLVIAGGGSGGGAPSRYGSGGGAGGHLTGHLPVTAGTGYTVTVGAGGVVSSNVADAGDDSVFGSITATGGGRGTTTSSGNNDYTSGINGGSGGGGGTYNQSGPGTGTSGQGNNGGAGSANAATGGGGGAGGAGGAAEAAGNEIGGLGGAGKASSITGSSVTRAGGGGGGGWQGTNNAGSAGGSGGGGRGNGNGTAGTDGTANTGSGGGGGGYGHNGGDGGSGIVIIRYKFQ